MLAEGIILRKWGFWVPETAPMRQLDQLLGNPYLEGERWGAPNRYLFYLLQTWATRR